MIHTRSAKGCLRCGNVESLSPDAAVFLEEEPVGCCVFYQREDKTDKTQ